jgi:hypothetical protein
MGGFLQRLAKRDGLYVSRPVLNADAWAKWAEKYGIPNPLPADKLHVTVIASRVSVTTKPQTSVLQVYSCDGSFSFLGPEADVLAFAWCDWCLSDRNWQLQSFGAVSDWPEYRPHVSLSMDAKGFELSDEAIAAMPPSFIFGPEVMSGFAPGVAAEVKKSAPVGEPVLLEDAAVKIAIDAVTKAAVDGWGDLAKFDQQTLEMIAAGRPVSKAAFGRLEGVDWLEEDAGERTKGAVFKMLGVEDRMVYGFASVSIAKGESVVDSHKHEITTKALRTLAHGLIKGQRAGKLNHSGEQTSEILEAFVFDADVWQGLGDYFEEIGEISKAEADVFRKMTFEGLMTGFHCADDAIWAFAKNNDFELSIGAEEGILVELAPNA